jgi:hypothetical protein
LRYPHLVNRLPTIRASDSDREQVSERLRRAAVEGRLTTEELEERLEAASAARTYGELDPLVADLPVSRPSHPPRIRASRWVAMAGATTILFAGLGTLAAAGHAFAERFGDHVSPFLHAHQLIAAAASIAAVFAGLALCATVLICTALLWRLRRSRGSPRKPGFF